MIFDDQTLTAGYAFASRLCETHRELSAHELTLVTLAAMSGNSLPSEKLEGIRRSLAPQCDGCDHVLFLIAALCEVDRISGARQIPPTRVVDIMSHIQVFREHMPKGAAIECHGDSTLPLALWFAAHHATVYFTGSQAFAEQCSSIASHEIHCINEYDPFIEQAYHFVSLYKGNISQSSFYRKLSHTNYRGAVVLTTWSFLSCDRPRILQLKQQFISSGELRTVIQLPADAMRRTLPALLQLAPADREDPQTVRLINARDWYILGHAGTIEVSYLSPILDQVDRKPCIEGLHRAPVPPAEDVSHPELLLRQCDLRMRDARAACSAEHFERLDECATLVRGQMLPAKNPHETAHVYREVVLTDIDEFGLISSASRILDNAPHLPRSREVALLKKNDILLSCKGSLLSLGRVGIVTESMPNWLPNQTFYLIRTELVDPIWLFHFLRSRTAQEYFQAHGSGTSVPQIKVGDLSALRVPVPGEEELKDVHRVHDDILKSVRKIQKLKKYQADLTERCQQVFDRMM